MNLVLNNPNQITGIIIFVNTILVFFLFIFVMWNTLTIRKLNKRYKKFMSAGFNEKNLEQLIDACLFKAEDAFNKTRDIQGELNKIESNMIKCVQKLGFVRYSAFDDVGSDQSFSIALLDFTDNGIVITGIHTRDTATVYAKLIEGGKSKYTLTAEEIQAIDKSRRLYGDRIYKEGKNVG